MQNHTSITQLIGDWYIIWGPQSPLNQWSIISYRGGGGGGDGLSGIGTVLIDPKRQPQYR